MQKKTIQFATVTKQGVVQKIGRSTVTVEQSKFNKKGIPWFDDAKLLKKDNDK